jgi:GNAT superfamily N-acetyltransferase
VPRTPIRVREAAAADIPILVRLGKELPGGHAGRRRGTSRPGLTSSQLTFEHRYAEALADSRRRVVLAVGEDGEPLGMAVFAQVSTSPLVDVPAVQVSHLIVDGGHRRKGAGRALVAAAAAYAGEIGRDQIMVNVLPGARDVHRFYARLGFAPLVVRRVTSIAALRRRLGAAELRPAPGLLRRRPGVRPLSSRAGARPARRAANAASELSGLPVRSRLWSNPLAER